MAISVEKARAAVLGYAEFGNEPRAKEWPDIPSTVDIIDQSDEETVIRLHGVISPYSEDVNAEKIGNLLNDIVTPRVRARINSPGGSVFEGLAIHHMLSQFPGRVITQNDGLTASAGALIFLAGEKRLMPRTGGLVMIHRSSALSFSYGNASEIEDATMRLCNILNKIDNEIYNMISDRAGMEADDAKAAVDAETWYGPQEAVDSGLATALLPKSAKTSPGDSDNKIRNFFTAMGEKALEAYDSQFGENKNIEPATLPDPFGIKKAIQQALPGIMDAAAKATQGGTAQGGTEYRVGETDIVTDTIPADAPQTDATTTEIVVKTDGNEDNSPDGLDKPIATDKIGEETAKTHADSPQNVDGKNASDDTKEADNDALFLVGLALSGQFAGSNRS